MMPGDFLHFNPHGNKACLVDERIISYNPNSG